MRAAGLFCSKKKCKTHHSQSNHHCRSGETEAQDREGQAWRQGGTSSLLSCAQCQLLDQDLGWREMATRLQSQAEELLPASLGSPRGVLHGRAHPIASTALMNGCLEKTGNEQKVNFPFPRCVLPVSSRQPGNKSPSAWLPLN